MLHSKRRQYAGTVTAVVTDAIAATWDGLWGHALALFEFSLTAAATEVGDTLDVYVDVSLDGGTTWLNVVHFAQATGTSEPDRALAIVNPGGSVLTAPTDIAADAAAGAVRHFLGDQVRVRYTLAQAATNDNESFTFLVNGYFV